MPENVTATMDRAMRLIRENAEAIAAHHDRPGQSGGYQSLPDPTGILAKLGSDKPGAGRFSKSAAQTLVAEQFDRKAIAARGLDYERLDQLTTEILLGVR